MTVRDSRSCGLIEPAGGRAKSICVFVVSLHRINNQDIEGNISNIMTIFFFFSLFLRVYYMRNEVLHMHTSWISK